MYSFQSLSFFFFWTQLLHNLPAGVGKLQPPGQMPLVFINKAAGSQPCPWIIHRPCVHTTTADLSSCDRHHMAGILPDPFQKKFANPSSRTHRVFQHALPPVSYSIMPRCEPSHCFIVNGPEYSTKWYHTLFSIISSLLDCYIASLLSFCFVFPPFLICQFIIYLKHLLNTCCLPALF